MGWEFVQANPCSCGSYDGERERLRKWNRPESFPQPFLGVFGVQYFLWLLKPVAPPPHTRHSKRGNPPHSLDEGNTTGVGIYRSLDIIIFIAWSHIISPISGQKNTRQSIRLKDRSRILEGPEKANEYHMGRRTEVKRGRMECGKERA